MVCGQSNESNNIQEVHEFYNLRTITTSDNRCCTEIGEEL